MVDTAFVSALVAVDLFVLRRRMIWGKFFRGKNAFYEADFTVIKKYVSLTYILMGYYNR